MHCLDRELCRNGRLATTISLLLCAIIYVAMFWSKQSTPPIPSLYFLMHWGCSILTRPFFSLMYRFVFAVGFSPYFDDITVTTLLSLHVTKAILALSSITASPDPLSSFCVSLTGFNGAFYTLFNRTVTVAAIPFSLQERSNWRLVKKLSVMIW